MEAGGDLLVDDSPNHNMAFDSPAECFEVTPWLASCDCVNV